jgi:hypothetical protein
MDLRKVRWRNALDRSGTEEGQVESFCESDYEPLSSLKCDEFLQ